MGKNKGGRGAAASASSLEAATSTKGYRSTSTSSKSEDVMMKPAASSETSTSSTSQPVELQDLSALAQEMEEQLMQELESLLARKRDDGGKSESVNAKKQDSNAAKNNDEGDARDATYWKHMYERLRDLRETEAEKMLSEVTRHADEREKSLLELIEHLQTQPTRSEAAKAALLGNKKDVRLSLGGGPPRSSEIAAAEGTAMDVDSSERVAELKAKLAKLKRILLGYQRITSLCITMDEEPSESAKSAADRMSRLNCTAINHVHKRAVKFQMQLNCDQEDSYALDARFKPVANLDHLPKFLRQDATLETKQCPLLMLAILKSLYDGRE